MPSSGIIVGTTPDGRNVPISVTPDGRARVDVPAEEGGTDDLLRAILTELQLTRALLADRLGGFSPATDSTKG